MKIVAKQYAQTLYELIENKPEKEVPGVIFNFVKQIAKNNNLKIAEKIIEKFNEIYNRENGIIEAEVTSREELRSKVRTKVRTYVSNKCKAKKVILINKVDGSIKGGIVVRVGDEVLDASVAGKLNDLRNILTK